MFEKYIEKNIFGSCYLKKDDNTELKYIKASFFIKNAKNICVLTGAGISTNIGIPDFRSKNGLYEKAPEGILSFSNLAKNPLEVYDFLYDYYQMIGKEPSKSHKLIASLEDMDKNITVITQNIDRLHHKAGSKDVIEFHGNLEKAHCIVCHQEYDVTHVLNGNIHKQDFHYKCHCGGLIKPNITLFGEDISELTFAEKEIIKADLVIIIGTSLQVEPFSSLPYKAPLETPFIIINRDKTFLDESNMSLVFNDDCDEVLEKIFELL